MGIFGASGFASPTRFQPLDGANLPLSIVHWSQRTPITVSNTVTETTVISGTGIGSATLGANWLNVGSIMVIDVLGTLKTLDASQTLRFRAYLGGVLILDSGVAALPSLASATPTRTDFDLSCSAIGVSGSVSAGATNMIYAATLQSFAGSTAPTNTTINTTQANAINLTATWGAANSSNILTVYGLTVTVIG